MGGVLGLSVRIELKLVRVSWHRNRFKFGVEIEFDLISVDLFSLCGGSKYFWFQHRGPNALYSCVRDENIMVLVYGSNIHY